MTMMKKLSAASVFIICAIVVSVALKPLRHPVFSHFGFNIIAITLQTLIYLPTWPPWFSNRALARFSLLTLLGFAVSVVALVAASIFLDARGVAGFQLSIAQLGVLRYFTDMAFFSVFSYCWAQLPISVILAEYLIRVFTRKVSLGSAT